jgi:glutaredoxin
VSRASRVGRLARTTTRASLVMALLAFALAGCPKNKGATGDGGSSSESAEGSPIVLKPDSAGLLLTWIDDKGDFHVEQTVADVPLMGKDPVRVVDPNREEGTASDRIFLADLRTLRADGTYAVRIAKRADFDAVALARRQEKGPTLANTAPSSSAPPSDGTQGEAPRDPVGAGDRPDPNAAARPAVIVYGASWCGPCHEAQAYLKRKGIAYVYKDIEQDSTAGREMQQKLEKSGRRGGSIPVLDVRGKILVGFNARQVDEALGRAL